MINSGLKGILVVASVFTLVAACNRQASQAQDSGAGTPEAVSSDAADDMSDETPGEWVALFNGHDLQGWRSYNADKPKPGWIVEDGAIVLDVDDDTDEMTGGDLITQDQYENFELELEWKISRGGNSGIFYGVREFPEQDVAYMTGIEMQVLDDDGHPDGKNLKTSAGACYALYAPNERAARPVGEYNRVRLVVDNGHVEHWLNGKRIVQYDIGSDDWNERVKNSKFADWEHFAEFRKGYIGLQDHSDKVWFRNIRVRELK